MIEGADLVAVSPNVQTHHDAPLPIIAVHAIGESPIPERR